jgi:glycine cleavage system aminomethyltransferase T
VEQAGGFELFLTDGFRGIDLWDSVMAAGSPYGIGPGCPNNTERLESGLLSYASDTDGDTDPFEAGLGGFVNLDVEHEFIGKRALKAKQAVAGSLRQLVNVTVDGVPPICEHPWTARLDGETVGQVRNLTWSPRLGRSIGVALLRADATSTGTMLDVDADGHPLRARVSATPFGVVN